MKSFLFTADQFTTPEETFSERREKKEAEAERKKVGNKRGWSDHWKMAISSQDFWKKNISVFKDRKCIERGNFSSTFPSVYKIGPLRVVNLPPLARIPLINEEHCARPKFCERHTRASTTTGGRQGIGQWEGRETSGGRETRMEVPSISVFSSLLRGNLGTNVLARNSKQSQSKLLSLRGYRSRDISSQRFRVSKLINPIIV